jgi:hypothetical protein
MAGMSKASILVQLDVDDQASVFDSVVAVDAGVDQLFRHHGVQPDQVQDLVHGAMFTRGAQDLHQTAIFVGGSNVTAAEEIMGKVTECFFGPMRVSVLFDANGANTTAAAAVLKAAKHTDLSQATTTVLGATGPVGQRAVRLLARAGGEIRVCSRRLERAEGVCNEIAGRVQHANLAPRATANNEEVLAATKGSDVVIAAGAAGVEFVSADDWNQLGGLQVAIDLNAVPPAGIAPVEPFDQAVERDGVLCYGAIGVGGLKMKIHKAALRALFESNDQVLDAEEVFEIGKQLS